MKAFVESLKAHTVTWFTDHQNVVWIVNSMDFHRSCSLNAVNINIHWIPRDLNSEADDISKFIDYDDYMINDTVFNALHDLWGPHTVIGSLAPTMPKSSASIQGFTSLV